MGGGTNAGYWPAHANASGAGSWWFWGAATNSHGAVKDARAFECADGLTERLLVAAGGGASYRGLSTNELTPRWYTWERANVCRDKSAITNLLTAYADLACLDTNTGQVVSYPVAWTPARLVEYCGLAPNFFTYTPWVALNASPSNNWDGVRRAINALTVTTNAVTFIGTNHLGVSIGSPWSWNTNNVRIDSYELAVDDADYGSSLWGLEYNNGWYYSVDRTGAVLSCGTWVQGQDLEEGHPWWAAANNSRWRALWTNPVTNYAPLVRFCFNVASSNYTTFDGCGAFAAGDCGFRQWEQLSSPTSTWYGALSHPTWVADPGAAPSGGVVRASRGYEIEQPVAVVDWGTNGFRYHGRVRE